MTLLALFDSKQKTLRSDLRSGPTANPTPAFAAKHLQKCFDDMYNEYSVANSLDTRGQRELAFVLDILKESVTLLLATTLTTSKVSATPTVVEEADGLLDVATQQLKATQAGKLAQATTQLTKSRWTNIPTPFGAFKADSITLWPIFKGVLGFFLFAMLWFQSQFFAAFIVLVLGFGDLALRLFGATRTKKQTLNHSVSVDSAQLLATVGELVKCAEKLLTEKQAVTALANPDVAVPNRLPVSLFQDLMEARYANDGDLALKRILKLPASLEDMGIRAVDYDGYNADFFDILPKIDEADGEVETAVPALIKGDQVLARGRVYK